MYNSKGFTLIELLVVVLIIGILASVALPQYEKAVWKARFSEVYTVINAIEKSLNLYVLENGFPNSSISLTKDDLSIELPNSLVERTLFNGNKYYCSKYICYEFSCMSSGCYWTALMYQDTSRASVSTEIAEMFGSFASSDHPWSKARTWYRSCYWEGDTAKIGKILCQSTKWDDLSEGF